MNSGLLNLVTRPLGGYIGDVAYRHYGTKGKKFWTLLCGLVMGASLLAGGFYLQNRRLSGNAQRIHSFVSQTHSHADLTVI